MTKPYRVNKDFSKTILMVSFTSLLLIIFITIGIVRFFIKEDICIANTKTLVGDNWTKKVSVSEKDLQTIPYLRSAVMQDNTVYLGTKEELSCEKDFKYFIFF